MEKLLLLAVVVGTAAIVILMIYLISRVEKIETIALHGPQPTGSLAVLKADKPWLGLQGVDLWDLLSGNPPPGYATDDARPWQPKYEHILYKHIETLFNRGMNDKKSDKTPEQPESPMEIKTLRENLMAFMPSTYASVLYESGFEVVTATGDDRLAIIDAVDRTCETLFSKINLETQGLMSTRLIPPAPAGSDINDSQIEELENQGDEAEEDPELAEQTALLEANLGRDGLS